MYSSFGIAITRERVGEVVERLYVLSDDQALNKVRYNIFERPDNLNIKVDCWSPPVKKDSTETEQNTDEFSL